MNEPDDNLSGTPTPPDNKHLLNVRDDIPDSELTPNELHIAKRTRWGNLRSWRYERQNILTRQRDDNGEVYFTVTVDPYWRAKRSQYRPYGDTMRYPAVWSKEQAVVEYVRWYLEMDTGYKEKLDKRIKEHLYILDNLSEFN
jgi:hypothetical protein